MLDWTTIDTVLLDMDGTLLDLKFDSEFYNDYLPRRMSETLELSHAQAHAAVKDLHQTTRGQLNWYCTHYWQATLNIDLLSLKHEIADRITIRNDTAPFLQWLAGRGIDDVRIVTNAHPDVLALKSDQTGLGGYIDADRMTCSHELGHAKEHGAFWEAYAKRYPFTSERTVLVDDNIEVLHAAARFGVGHLIAPAKPDSSAPRIDTQDFASIDTFHDLMDSANPS